MSDTTQGDDMTERCKPPPELRADSGWHWVEIDGRERCAYWWERTKGDWCWWNASNDHGWRYLAPVTPPAVVAALVEALECIDAIRWEDSGTTPESYFAERCRDASVIADKALALYREAGR